MIEGTRKRPIRLWVAALMNILVAGLSLGLLVFLAASARAPEALRPSAAAMAMAASVACFLTVASVLALLGKRHGGYLMLLAALIFYGILIEQSAAALGADTVGLDQATRIKLLSNVVRTALELLVNLWAVLSSRTRQFFAVSASTPET